MSRATPQMRALARRLISLETTGSVASETKSPAGFHAGEKLRPQLVRLMGTGGFRVLLSRALALAGPEIHWLRAVHVKADGSLEGLEELHAQVPAQEFSAGRNELLAQLLGLLVAFIGEDLTLRLVCEVWPELSLNDFDLASGDENEKAK